MKVKFKYDDVDYLENWFDDYTYFEGRTRNYGLFGVPDTVGISRDQYPAIEDAEKFIGTDHVFVRVYKYEHGNVAYSASPFSCRFDSGQIGWLGVHKDKIREWHGVARVSKRLVDLVTKKLSTFLEGTLTDVHNGHVYCAKYGDDSIGGLIGSDYAVESAIEHLGCTREEAEAGWTKFTTR